MAMQTGASAFGSVTCGTIGFLLTHETGLWIIDIGGSVSIS
jgi:hypothetical protein